MCESPVGCLWRWRETGRGHVLRGGAAALGAGIMWRAGVAGRLPLALAQRGLARMRVRPQIFGSDLARFQPAAAFGARARPP